MCGVEELTVFLELESLKSPLAVFGGAHGNLSKPDIEQ